MTLTREYSSIFDALRLKIKIPKSQPLLDFAFGGHNRNIHISKKHQVLLGEEVNIYQITDPRPDSFYGLDVVQPKGNNWEFHERDGLWVGLYTYMPDWLKEIGDNRKKQRQQIMENKKNESLTLE